MLQLGGSAQESTCLDIERLIGDNSLEPAVLVLER